MAIIEPKAEDFFATAKGVYVNVNVGRHAVRVHFPSLDGPATVVGETDDCAEVALAAATHAFEKHKPQLQALFERIALEIGRAG